VASPDLLSISSQRCQRYHNTLDSLGICGFLGSYPPGAWGRVLGLPAGGGWRRCHSAPLEDRTLCFAPLATTGMTTTGMTTTAMTTTAMTTTAMTTTAMTTTAMTTTAIPLRAPGDGEHPSFPPPAGPSRWPVKATPLFSCYSYRDNAHRLAGKLWGPGGCL